MEDFSPEDPFGAITPYYLEVEGKWRLSAAFAGMFLCEYVTCPFCENQKGLIFESDSTRLGEMADITCPKPCGKTFQIQEITGYDLQQRLAFLAGDETDPVWLMVVLAEDPSQPTGPLPPADDEDENEDALPASPAAAAEPEPTQPYAAAPRMRTARRPGRSRVENHGVIVGPGESVTGPVRATAGSTSGNQVAREMGQALAEIGRAVDEAARPASGARVYRNDGVVNTGRMTGRVTTVVADGSNNRQISVRDGQVTVDGQPAAPSGPVPRKVAAKAERAARDAQRHGERLARESGGRSSTTVQVHGENNSVITNHTDHD